MSKEKRLKHVYYWHKKCRRLDKPFPIVKWREDEKDWYCLCCTNNMSDSMFKVMRMFGMIDKIVSYDR